jgi:hypothetical protein
MLLHIYIRCEFLNMVCRSIKIGLTTLIKIPVATISLLYATVQTGKLPELS